jgi:hypothetical protein
MEDQEEGNEWYSYARLTACLLRVNSISYTNHLKDGSIDDAAFEKKNSEVVKISDEILGIVLVNLGWFLHRIRQLITDDGDALKNG